MIRSTRST